MKVSKIPGLGRFGLFIDDLDFTKITKEEWMKLGELHLQSLVTIIRNVRLPLTRYEWFMEQWGWPRQTAEYRTVKKYGYNKLVDLMMDYMQGKVKVDDSDLQLMNTVANLLATNENNQRTAIMKVSGKKNEKGEPLGMFAEGELLWHSNESGTLTFAPGVSLLGANGMVGSSTGFLTTVDYYESLTESFRSELDEMVLLHTFTPGKINPGLRLDQDFLMYRNMCPEADTRIPLVIRSPYGYTGLHYSVNTVCRVDGMTQQESDKLFERINKELFVEKYQYDHWYTQDNDLLLFDNSITLHRRLGGIADRLAFRIQYDYSNLQKDFYQPYLQEEFADQYTKLITDIATTLQIPDFKLPA